MKLAIKHPKTILWKTDFDLTSIEDKIQSGKIDHSWLVCPLGESNKAITIADYLDNPSIFSPVIVKRNPKVEGKENAKTLFQIGMITMITSIILRLSLNTFLLVKVTTINPFVHPGFKIAMWKLCNELCYIGIWCGAVMLVAHAVLAKTNMQNRSS